MTGGDTTAMGDRAAGTDPLAAVRTALAAAGVDIDRYAADLPLVAVLVDRSLAGSAELGRVHPARPVAAAPAPGSPVNHPQDLPLREQAARIAAGDLDPAAVLEATLARIAERNPPLNSTAGDGARLTVGVVPALWDDLDPGVADACRAALDASGWPVRELDLPATELGATVFRALMAAASPSAPPVEVLDELPPVVRAGVLAGRVTPAWVVARADRLRARWRRTLAELFGVVDVLAWPTVPAPAPPMTDPTVTLPRQGRVPAELAAVAHTVVANVTGVPGVSVRTPGGRRVARPLRPAR